MSTLDEYEHRRGPVRRRQHGKPLSAHPTKKHVQLALKLMGGTTEKDRGEPFNDPIPF
ncbi:MAG TPA: hypothetical protein VJA26_12320 [Gammaproteobacteria bacterium]|nr:hypothetical protein [Gammaproteobacteria bacterium]